MLPVHVVAVLWNAAATSPFLIAAAAEAVCTLVWVIDSGDERTAGFRPLLERSGTVVDQAGSTPVALADELGELGVRGVVTFNDPPIRLAARLAEKLGTVFHSERTADLLTDKLAQRAALAAAGVPSAAFAAIEPGDGVPDDVPLPAVLKPRSGASSRDVFMVTTPAELDAGLARSGDQPMLLEEYLQDVPDAPDHSSGVVSVESVVVDGEITHFGITGRFPLAPPFRETGAYHPGVYDDAERLAFEDVATRAAVALGARDGFLHTELKRTPQGPRVVEVNGRIGGCLPEMTARAGGSDLVREALRLSLGLPHETFAPLTGVGWIYLGHADRDAHEVVAVDGIEHLSALADVSDVRLNRAPGATLDSREGSFGCVYEVDGHSPDHTSAFATAAAILETVRVEAR